MPGSGERWPPVYDADDLVREIKRLTSEPQLEQEFFEWRLDRSTGQLNDICQGDVVLLSSDVPVILDDGQPSLVEHPEKAWLVIGNTCDFDRTLDDARWTQLVPIGNVGNLAEVSRSDLDAARRYTQSRTFYVPPWSSGAESSLHLADLLLPVAVDKRVFQDSAVARLQARMSSSAASRPPS